MFLKFKLFSSKKYINIKINSLHKKPYAYFDGNASTSYKDLFKQ